MEKTRCSSRLVIFKNYFFVWPNFKAESVNCSLFLTNLEKTFLQFDLQKKNFVKHIENLPQHLSEKFIGDNLSISLKEIQIYRLSVSPRAFLKLSL